MYESDRILDRLEGLHPKQIDLSLDRIKRLLATLDNPQDKCPPIIHIAGTNGKGSTLAFLRAMLQAQGKIVHSYTSPHLQRFHERIQIAGTDIDERALVEVLETCERANAGEAITFFEIITAAAFLAFSRHKADYLLLEVGLGGRLDTTNIITPLLSIITPISLDHQDFLGDTIELIAAEKAGILKPNCAAVIAPQDHAAEQVIGDMARVQNTPLYIGNQDWHVRQEQDRLVFEAANALLDLPLPCLAGSHQITNAGTAIMAARLLQLDETEIATGLRTATWRARLQRLAHGKLIEHLHRRLPHATVWLDGGHNPAAAQALAEWANEGDNSRPLHIIIGQMKNKLSDVFFENLKAISPAPHFHCVPIENEENCRSAEELAALCHGSAHKSLTDALAEITASDARILICGSLYLAGSVLNKNM